MLNPESKYEWLLFDADNTLFDFDGASHEAFDQTLRDYQLQLGDHAYGVYKKFNMQVWHELELGTIDQVELRRKRFSLFLNYFNLDFNPIKMNADYLNNLVEKSQLLQDSIHLLNHLHPRFKLGLITNGLKEVQRPRIRKVDIGHYFDVIVVSDEIGYAKPQAEFYLHTFKQMGYPNKEKVLAIGDSLNSDIRGGVDYGVDTCWYNPGQIRNPESYQPTFTIENLRALIDIV